MYGTERGFPRTYALCTPVWISCLKIESPILTRIATISLNIILTVTVSRRLKEIELNILYDLNFRFISRINCTHFHQTYLIANVFLCSCMVTWTCHAVGILISSCSTTITSSPFYIFFAAVKTNS